MCMPRGDTYIIPNVIEANATPTSLSARFPLPQAVLGSSMYNPSISRPSIRTTPLTSCTSGTSHPWKPPGKTAYTTKTTQVQ